MGIFSIRSRTRIFFLLVLQNLRTDSGIIFVKGRPFAMSIMTADARDERAAERAIGEIALEAYYYFEMRTKTSDQNRALEPK